MSDDKPQEGMLSLTQAIDYLTKALGSSPDQQTLLEWVQFGHLVGYLKGGTSKPEVYISEESLKSFVTQFENRREPRLVLMAVDVWKRKLNFMAVSVTLASPSGVVTTEELCKNESHILLEGSCKATISAITELVSKVPYMKLLRVKQHFLAEVGQSVVTVLIETGEGDSARRLPGIARVSEANAMEAASRATLNALNRTIAPYLSATLSWKDIFKKILPIK
jgi:hypothetical protein